MTKQNLWKVISENLKKEELIYVIKDDKSLKTNFDGIMEEFTFDQLFNHYSSNEIVKDYWHEDGLCIVLK